MVAELPGAATDEAMSRPEQEETEEVFEEARGEASSQSELMAVAQYLWSVDRYRTHNCSFLMVCRRYHFSR